MYINTPLFNRFSIAGARIYIQILRIIFNVPSIGTFRSCEERNLKWNYARKDEKIFNITIRFEQYFSHLYNYSEYYNNKLRKKFYYTYLELKEKKKRDFETFQSSLTIFKSPVYIQQTL